jgi:hypothetical protein
MRVALVCIAKDEENYIKEWIDYHFKLGFDDIFIYQNDWRWPVEMHNVHKIEFDGSFKQVEAYNNFIQTYYEKYDWIAFFDLDEFLVLKKHKNIKDFLIDYKDYLAIGINWVIFGDNDLSFNGDYSVLNRFTKRQSGVNVHIKSIIKSDKNIKHSIHNPIDVDIVDTSFNIFTGPFNHNGKDDVAQLNHYFCKTWIEWEKKRNKGSAAIPRLRPDSEYHVHNLNEIEDRTALDFYLK